MIQQILMLYLMKGLPVGSIARTMKVTRPVVRARLRDGGIIIRPTSGGYQKGRDPVCEAVCRAGYESFHAFAKANSLVPLSRQMELLGTSERSITRIYSVYRDLLNALSAAGVALPSTQNG